MLHVDGNNRLALSVCVLGLSSTHLGLLVCVTTATEHHTCTLYSLGHQLQRVVCVTQHTESCEKQRIHVCVLMAKPKVRRTCVRVTTPSEVKEQQQGEAEGQNRICTERINPQLALNVGISAPAQKALPRIQANAYRLCLYSAQLPLHNPTESTCRALTI